MLLTRELVQPIVDKTMAIIKTNINIMDHRAVIIGSGDPERLGSYHEGAARVIGTGCPLEIHSKDLDILQGVRPGVNLPIAFDGKIVGVVGISGEPGEIRSSGELVRTTVELMLEQLVLKEHLNLETKARESFLHDLLTGATGPHTELFLVRADILGYDVRLPRYAILIGMDRFSQVVEEKFSTQVDLRSQELHLQQFKERLLHAIARVFPAGGKEIVAFAGGDKFVVLKVGCFQDGRWRRREEGTGIIEKIKREIQRDTGLTVTAGVGRLYADYPKYSLSFKEALGAIRIGQRLWGRGRIFWAEEMLVENLVTSLPPAVLDTYVREVLGPLFTDDITSHSAEIIQTLEALFEHGLNVTHTAQALFVHRNTVLFRLEKLKKLTGYRPVASFRDAVELKLAFLARHYLKSNGRTTADHDDEMLNLDSQLCKVPKKSPIKLGRYWNFYER